MRPEWVGPYEVLRKLGAGGMGTVYLALDEDGRTVAIKVIHPHVADDANGLKRLAREVEAMKRVASPYVAELLDEDLGAETPYIVTRYVQGRSLQQIVERRGPLLGDKLWDLNKGLVAALDAIHSVDVVHRDLTPHNVMIADGVPVVIDFGIAQAFDFSRITQTMIGTPGFVAPEVISGQRTGPPADVFSFAATMVFAATGRKCFGGPTFLETLRRTLEDEPDLTGVPREMMPSLWRALRKDPEERPTTGGLVAGYFTFSPQGLSPEGSGGNSASRSAALWAAAGEARKRGDLDRAAKLYAEVRQIAVVNEDPGSEMFALYQLGQAAELRSDHSAAQGFYERALRLATFAQAAPIATLALRGLEQLAHAKGDYERARAYNEQARQVLEERYKEGYPKPPGGAESEPFLRPWVPRQ
jgi:tetratricopeptide (TPR) repeat protein